MLASWQDRELNESGRRSRCRRIALWILLGAMIDICLSAGWLLFVASAPIPVQHRANEALITLMGDFNDQFTGLGHDTLRRLNHAIAQYRQGRAAYLVCIGGSRPQSGLVGAEMMRDYLEEQGVPRQRILTRGTSYDTPSNLREIRRLIDEHGWQEVGLISSPLHLFRINRSFAGSPGETAVSLLPYSYREARPRVGPVELWRAIHYEWCTYLLYRLPDPLYRLVVAWIRPQ